MKLKVFFYIKMFFLRSLLYIISTPRLIFFLYASRVYIIFPLLFNFHFLAKLCTSLFYVQISSSSSLFSFAFCCRGIILLMRFLHDNENCWGWEKKLSFAWENSDGVIICLWGFPSWKNKNRAGHFGDFPQGETQINRRWHIPWTEQIFKWKFNTFYPNRTNQNNMSGIHIWACVEGYINIFHIAHIPSLSLFPSECVFSHIEKRISQLCFQHVVEWRWKWIKSGWEDWSKI